MGKKKEKRLSNYGEKLEAFYSHHSTDDKRNFMDFNVVDTQPLTVVEKVKLLIEYKDISSKKQVAEPLS